MQKDIIPTIAAISAIISYHYGKEIKKYYTYFSVIEVIAKLATEVYIQIEDKLPDLIPVEFDLTVKQEARRLLKVNNSIHILDEATHN